MIPKIIHYCWLSDEPIPTHLQECINSWKRLMPDYKIIKWDTREFDIKSNSLVQEAFDAKKWAFATDYIRAYALYQHGGIYLDSDVMLYKNLSNILLDNFVSGMEYHMDANPKGVLNESGYRQSKDIYVPGIGIQAAFLASSPYHPLVKDVLDFYKEKKLHDLLNNKYYAPVVWAHCAEKYGFRYVDTIQQLASGINILSTKEISNYDQFTSKSYLVHFCAGSWVNDQSIRKQIMSFIKRHRALFIAYNYIKKL